MYDYNTQKRSLKSCPPLKNCKKKERKLINNTKGITLLTEYKIPQLKTE